MANRNTAMAARSVAAAGTLALALSACQGVIGEAGQPGAGSRATTGGASTTTGSVTTGGAATGSGTGSTDGLCAAAGKTLRVGRSLMRRLTRPQFNHTVRDLLGVTNDPAAAIAPDERIGPFTSNGIAPITDLVVQQHAEAASSIALAAQPRMNDIAGCDLAADAGTTCAVKLIDDFGLRSYRRPLEAAERDKYVALFSLGRTNGGVANGFQLVVEAMLQSPFFLYHADLGAQPGPSEAPVPLTAYELASRLSYFLWNTTPDRELLTLAATDRLRDPAVLAAQVERLLGDERASDAIPSFHLQWLGIDDMDSVAKDPILFPQFGPELVAAMQNETGTFADRVIRSGDARLGTLFTAGFTYATAPLLALYGTTAPAGFKAGDQIALDPKQRAGLLTQAAFLSAKAHRDQTSPVHRGLLVRENLLCQPIQAPPPNANTTPPTPTPTTTTRDRFAAHQADPVCGGCHRMMDPIGLGFENYDPIGAFRTHEGTSAVDPTGQILEASADVAGAFNGAVELGRKLAGSRQVGDCVATQWFRFSLGRMETNDDACTLQSVRSEFAASGGNVRALLKSIALGDAFRHVRVVGGSTP